MAHLQRLIAAVFLFVSLPAFSITETYLFYGGGTDIRGDLAWACANAYGGTPAPYGGSGRGDCYGAWEGTKSVLSAGYCWGDKPYWDQGKQICTGTAPPAPPDCSKAASYGSASSSWLLKGDVTRGCSGGCSYHVSGAGNEIVYSKSAGYTLMKGQMVPTGGSCDTSTEPGFNGPDGPTNPTNPGTGTGGSQSSDTPDPGSCKGGGVPYTGTVNGKTVTVCGTPSKSTTTTTSDSTTSSTKTTNTDGTTGTTTGSESKQVTKSTSCDGGQCTTTTTITTTTGGGSGSSGGSSSSETKTESVPKDDFCTQNPRASVCKDSQSSFGGSCGAFSCDGDAVQCAIAREQHERNCQLFDTQTPFSQKGNEIANGDVKPAGHPGNSPEQVDLGIPGRIDQTNPFGNACPSDFNLSLIGGTVVTVPLSNACDVLRFMGYVAVAFSLYAATKIVMGGV